MSTNGEERWQAIKYQPQNQKNFHQWIHQKLRKLKQTHQKSFDVMNKYFPVEKTMTESMEKMTDDDIKVAAKECGFHPSITELLLAIQTDPIIHMFFHHMYEQQTVHLPPGKLCIQSWQEALIVINECINEAIEFDHENPITAPLYCIFSSPIATPVGNTCFLHEKVNALMKEILIEWGKYLTSKSSCYVLTDAPKGWFSIKALEAMPNFNETYVCDPSKPFWGFTSWDDFFVRKFKDGARSVDDEEDDCIIVNPCEATPYKVKWNVKKYDQFWIKEQNYSMEFVLNKNPLAAAFNGGTIYQGLLCATNYHRFHSPVNGIIHHLDLVEGSYFSQPYIEGGYPILRDVLPYLAHVATRGIFYIKADNPNIGLIAFIAVGMTEVSTVEMTVKVGDRVKKGHEIGMFHYGGSNFLLVFRGEVNIKFDDQLLQGLNSGNIKLNKRIGHVLAPEIK
ncbi:uncharacterized protein [Clytia hemisphaerica]|uniref:L-tryptophan decarboxylase PsiD-like domain-containing protein n=1 Tax=Clytia hemisphaerica TaxID=252671 RepID=A0A7M5XA88_9CNID